MEGVWGVAQPLYGTITSKDTAEAKSCPSILGLCHHWDWREGTARGPASRCLVGRIPPADPKSPQGTAQPLWGDLIPPSCHQPWQGCMASGDSPASVRDSPGQSD